MAPKNKTPLQIHTIRGQKVLLDSELSTLYGVLTKRLNEAVKRNKSRFPAEFCFQVTRSELAVLRSQIATSKAGRGGQRYLPYAFSEHGALMAATVLNSRKAVQMSLFIVKAFVQMREELTTSTTILRRLAEIDKKLLMHDTVLRDIYHKLLPLLSLPDEPSKPKIGFHEGNR